MNGLDLFILILIVIAIIYGAKKGFISQLANFLGLFTGVYFANIYAIKATSFICDLIHKTQPNRIIYIIVYIIIVILVFYLVYLLGKLIGKMLQLLWLGWLNRLLGAVFGVFYILLLATVIAIVIGFIAKTFNIDMPNWYTKSELLAILRNGLPDLKL